MKTEAVKETIINNYRIISGKSKVKMQDNIATIWGLQYKPCKKQEGFVNELGTIRRKKAEIEIRNDKIKTIKKPWFSTWNKTLTSINAMLENIIANLDNPDIVVKRGVRFLCFPKDFADRIAKINQKIR